MLSRVGKIQNVCAFCTVRVLRPSPASLLRSPPLARGRQFTASAVLERAKKSRPKPKPKVRRPADDRPVIIGSHGQSPVSKPTPIPVDPGRTASLAYFKSLPEWDPIPGLQSDTEVVKVVRACLVATEPPSPIGVPRDHLPRISAGGLVRGHRQFQEDLLRQIEYGGDFSAAGGKLLPSLRNLQAVAQREGKGGVVRVLNGVWQQYMGFRTAPSGLRQNDRLARTVDARFPQEWYPITREIQRTWHLHVGPTNSGKTYRALKRLEEAGNGIYAGPLRLLAHEIYEKMNAKGIACNLVTGDDVRVAPRPATVLSSTMEMVDITLPCDVCVLDEIQMIGDQDRGWAWTQALLGVQAKEVHMCGEERVVDLITRLAATVGDKLIVHRYNRLGPLEVETKSLNSRLQAVRKGDCVVTFSRRNIFALKRAIEEKTGMNCAVVYGGLPPETRTRQARLFNDTESEFDVLVASDAVGMGLNLSIKRVVFEALHKWNGKENVAMPVPSIKQIAGRAGRYKVNVPSEKSQKGDETVLPLPAAPSIGYVTTLDKGDLKALRQAMNTEVKPLKSAGILPTSEQIERFAAQLGPAKFSHVLQKIEEYLKTSTLFHSCSLGENVETAKLFDHVQNLSVSDRLCFIMAPIGHSPAVKAAVVKMAEAVANSASGSILDIEGIDLEILDMSPWSVSHLQRLEELHKTLIAWLWLSYRFPATFFPRETAQAIKVICEERIATCLGTIQFVRKKRQNNLANLITTPDEAASISSLVDGKAVGDEDDEDDIVEARTEPRVPEDNPPKDNPPKGKRAVSIQWQKCSVCHQTGHTDSTCPQLVCYNCDSYGHLSVDCPDPPRRTRRSKASWQTAEYPGKRKGKGSALPIPPVAARIHERHEEHAEGGR